MLHAFPGIGHRIVHMYRIPHDISQETHGIFVKRNGFDGNVSGFFVIAPVRRGDNLSRCPVNDFPPAFDIIAGVWREHIRVQSFHQVDRKAGSAGGVKRGHQIHLLDLVRILSCPVVIFSRGVVGGIDFRVHIPQFLREIRSVAVAQGVCAPAFHQFQSAGNYVHVGRDGYKSFAFVHDRGSFLFLPVLRISFRSSCFYAFSIECAEKEGNRSSC